jgi:translation initiation factor IF-1
VITPLNVYFKIFYIFINSFFQTPGFFASHGLMDAFFVGRMARLLSDSPFCVSKDVIELLGVVKESFPNATFRVRILSEQAKDHELLCTLAGRMRVHRVRILPGDRVKVEMTPYDLEKGRITYRLPPGGTLSPDPAGGTPSPHAPSSPANS